MPRQPEAPIAAFGHAPVVETECFAHASRGHEMRESPHARKVAMPDYVLIAVVALVPILALMLALACGQTREAAGDARAEVGGDGLADDARS
jgi:hypothetical protein